ncbi:hypothetical protein C4D60_Mb09t20840 [Musa balbisiana]|uniref:Terpene synthase metal-binding domain-containing protein n=1 Tax=Musa balbisiana TaxID=52838 RepID=A0A4S8IHW0_MUSBA|nr:hypothetical protein C4D60_Mb09t20840 [Musa balbisiana]
METDGDTIIKRVVEILVECYFWILGVFFELYYSRARVITTKVIALISILDDIYNVYSTLEESQQLTQAIQRCNSIGLRLSYS